jgi:FkbM family methyltransferase
MRKLILAFKFIRKLGVGGLSILLKRIFYGRRALNISLKGITFPFVVRNRTSDIQVFNQIFFYGDYDLDFKVRPKVIIDCGAHIGLASIYFKNRYPEANIIAIEPQRQNFELLMKNTKGYKNIYCRRHGVWNKDANLRIIDTGQGNYAFTTHEVEYENDDTVKSISIDDIMKEFHITEIDVLKMDIEGSEKEIFEQNYEKWLPHTKILIVELHETMRNGCEESFSRALEKYDFSISRKGENMVCFSKSLETD